MVRGGYGVQEGRIESLSASILLRCSMFRFFVEWKYLAKKWNNESLRKIGVRLATVLHTPMSWLV